MKDSLIWAIVTLIIIGTTIGIFVVFAPANIGYSYWLAMSDIVLTEIIIGAYRTYNHMIYSNRHKNNFSIAMGIGMSSTFIIFSSIGIVIDLALVIAGVSDRVILWLIISRWVLLLAVLTPMWFIGKTGTDQDKSLDLSRNKRNTIVSNIEKSLNNLRNLHVDSKEQASWRKVIDEMETIRNKMRSRASDTAIDINKEAKIEQLANELVNIISSAEITPSEAIHYTSITINKITDELR
jgi:hypothetical protein